MAYGLQAFKDDGSILFDTEYITYGLVKSATLTHYTKWGCWLIKSSQLPPTSESSWAYYTGTNLNDEIVSVEVSNATDPIFFLSGDGSPCGVVGTGATRTYLFHGCIPNTKVYVFDKMRDLGTNAGMHCFDSSGVLTFSAEMPPLNIVSVVDPPSLGPLLGGGPYYPPNPISGPVYVGGRIETLKPWSSSDKPWVKGVVNVPSGISEEIATCLTFSRGGWQVYDNSGSLQGCYEGCGGTTNGDVRFYFMQSYASTNQLINSGIGWGDIPRDKAPQALVIKTSDYPFPFG